MIKPYFQLVRFPGIFTAFSNILLGFFVSTGTSIDWLILIPLLTSSGSLFLAGMALNDYFDYFVDKKERPERPLPSKKIPRKTALYIGFAFIIIANISALSVGISTLMITIIMTILILTYDVKSKHIPILGILNLSSIRFFNVILGASAFAIGFEIFSLAVPLGIFVAGISILARNEISSTSKKAEIANSALIILAIIYLVIITFDKGVYHWPFLGLFITLVFLPRFILKEKSSITTQKIVTFQLLSISILDATIVMAITNNIVFAILALSMIVPGYITLRKLYVT